MLPVLLFTSNVILALMLVGQALMYRKDMKQLLNRLLESKGVEGIPEDSPLGNVLGNLGAAAQPPEMRQKIKEAQERVRFNIPNMTQFKAK